MGSIYLIRHGQASFGADDYDVLSPLGVQQACIVGQHLVDMGLVFDRCLSGDLLRQQHTAQHAMAQFDSAPSLEIDTALNEFDAFAVVKALVPTLLPEHPEALAVFNDPRACPAEFQRLFDVIIKRWITGAYDAPQLESWQDFLARVQSGLDRLRDSSNEEQNIVVFTSAGTLTALLHLLTHIPANDAFKLTWHIANTSLSRLKFSGCEVTLASFNSHAHLQLLKTPSLITYR